MTTFEQKYSLLASFGVGCLGRLVFDEAMRGTEARKFLSDFLGPAKPAEIVVGPDFRFGRDAEGHEGELRDWASLKGINVERVELQHGQGIVYSSSHVRGWLKVGMVEAAGKTLGRPYRLSGEVIRGAGRGRGLGFPTANLGDVEQLVPGPGVYATVSTVMGKRLEGMTSIGHNPTFGLSYLTIETNLFDFDEECYGEKMDVDFISHFRGMMRFDSRESLIRRLKADEREAKEILAKRAAPFL